MSKTDRYKKVEDKLSKHLTFTGTFRKFGSMRGEDSKSICLTNIHIDKENEELIDHIWVNTRNNATPAFKTGQKVTFQATIKERKRPAESIFDTEILDIKLSNIKYKD